MLHGDRDVKVAMDTCKQYPLEGIPDNGIEFTLLHEIVSQKARLRLERVTQKLSGRDVTDFSRTPAGRKSAPTSTPPWSIQQESTTTGNTQQESITTPGSLEQSVAPQPDATASQQAVVVVAKPKPPQLQVRTTTRAPMITALGQGVITRNVSEASTQIALGQGNNNTNMVPRPLASGLTPDRRRLCIMRRMSLDEAKASLNQKMCVAVFAPSCYPPNSKNELPIGVGDELWIQTINADENRALVITKQHRTHGWCPLDCLCVGEVVSPFAPQADWAKLEKYLPLSVGDVVVVTHRYHEKWEGWCYGHHWGDVTFGGFFPSVLFITPKLLLAE